MTTDSVLTRWSQGERINFLLTNRIPRRWATLFMGWFSRIRNPWVRDASIAIWRYFADDLALHEARKTEFDSLHDCFIRQLKPGARPIDRDSPLFEALRSLRRSLAKDAGVPPYVIFHDSTLMEMADRRPTTREQFGTISGVGASKLERYADRFLDVLRRHSE